MKGAKVVKQIPVLRLLVCVPLPGVPEGTDPLLEDLSEEELAEHFKDIHVYTVY